jgi:hypothetical protein
LTSWSRNDEDEARMKKKMAAESGSCRQMPGSQIGSKAKKRIVSELSDHPDRKEEPVEEAEEEDEEQVQSKGNKL